ncbi:DUF1847 domain-containing protein [Chlorobium sp. KB01]|uniref:DUF1847 domain-containing protein n=1 Tax=Chlorobium sp. KB01 TaxID=1917528 RepID=UPI000975F281|nr:DUF1847 domain-containing protein [Chlorobium sp. KB01]
MTKVNTPGEEHSGCSDCGLLNCYRQDRHFPDFCPTEAVGSEELDSVTGQYRGETLDAKIARASAEVEGTYYGKLTRVEEIIAFANRIGAKKIGLATCIGLSEESRIFARVLEINDLEPFSVICKVGSVDKCEIGIDENLKIQKGSHESLCNPILQAKLLNEQKTELNVIIGLCVGHDSLFMKHSDAPVTTLITKDRLLGHNPAAALYTSGFYYKRLFAEGRKL